MVVSSVVAAGAATLLVPNRGMAGDGNEAEGRRNSELEPNGDGADGVVKVGVGNVMFVLDPNEKVGIDPELPGAFMLLRNVLPPDSPLPLLVNGFTILVPSPLLLLVNGLTVLVSSPLLLLAKGLLAVVASPKGLAVLVAVTLPNDDADADTPNESVV
jgi:hypothetical protein